MAATVISQAQPGGLLQRRLSQSQYASQFDLTGLMSTYNMTFKPSMPMADSTMSLECFDVSLPNFPNSGFAPTAIYSNAGLGLDTSFTNPYNLAQDANFMEPTLSNLSQSATWSSSSNFMGTPAPVDSDRRSSLSSMTGSPCVKTEAHSPIQPLQMFYDPSPYSSQTDDLNESSPVDSDDSGVVFSTDVDVLMKAIQAKTRPAEPKQKARSQKVRQTFGGMTAVDSQTRSNSANSQQSKIEEAIPMLDA
ncbi:DNA-binding transcription factor [Elasticomyces elasticus]|nr:DNA-binding transcription factor [Elasticomyces elasticus]